MGACRRIMMEFRLYREGTMSKGLKTTLLVLSFVILAFTVAGALGVKAGTGDGAYRQMGVYNDVLEHIETYYVETPDLGKVSNGALHGVVEALDGDSSYMSSAEYKQYKQMAHPSAGIGAVISKHFGYGFVISVIPGGPGDKAGLETGDIIEALEEKSTREMSLATLTTLLSGPGGTTVNLSVVRASKAQPQKITITRGTAPTPSLSYKSLENNEIGYLRPEGFPKGRSQEISAALHELAAKGAKKIILDLRNSADGDPAEGVATANLFLDHGEIGYLEGQMYPRQSFTADPSKVICKLPLVVIVNHSTAGAAEILAGAILDNARGDLLGDKTFGSANVQKTYDLQDGGALILSVAKYHLPTGKAIQDSLVTPNILVADKAEELSQLDENEEENPEAKPEPKKPQTDEQLRRAIEQLTKPAPVKAADAAAPSKATS